MKTQKRRHEDKVVMITGGARGLGLAFARKYADRGMNLALCSRTNEDLVAAKKLLAEEFPKVRVLTGVCDVGDIDQVKWFVDQVNEEFGAIHILVNCAGVIQVGPYETMNTADFTEIINANLWGMINTCQIVTPNMIEQGFGKILNVTSVGGIFPVPHLLPYTASKFGAVGFSTALAAEMRKYKITVTTAMPGLMRTGSFVNALFKGQQEKELSLFTLSSTLPVLTMSPDRAVTIMVNACGMGKGFKVVGLQTKAQRMLFSLLPNVSIKLMGWLNAQLPTPTVDKRATNFSSVRSANSAKGKAIRAPQTSEFVKNRAARAVKKYNELRPPRTVIES